MPETYRCGYCYNVVELEQPPSRLVCTICHRGYVARTFGRMQHLQIKGRSDVPRRSTVSKSELPAESNSESSQSQKQDW